jgi:hypothetical protein
VFRCQAAFDRTEQILIALRERRKGYIDAHNEYLKQFEWKAGLYNLTIKVMSHDPRKTYSIPYQFRLTEADALNLSVNVETMCAMMQGNQETPIWNWAYPYSI